MERGASMNPVTPECVPLCGQVGHEFVTATVWVCRHHGAVTGTIMRYVDEPPEPAVRSSSQWLAGPFTVDIDLVVFLDQLAGELQELLHIGHRSL